MDRAVHYYGLAADADPAYAPVLSNLGAAYLDLGDRDLALSYLNRALRADPALAAAYNNRALVALTTRDYRRAEQDLLLAARRSPALPVVQANLARLYEVEGRADEARRWAARPMASSADGTARRQESIGAFTPGMPASRLPEWVGQTGARQIKVPLGTTPDQALLLVVAADRGVALLLKDGMVEAVGAMSKRTLATAQGLKPGDRVARVEAMYGRPAGVHDLHAFDVWAYPARSLTVFTAGDRVQAVWVGRVP